ncbi:MAG TPA: galactokinase [Trebonia sp.]|nr:galactokinase [Trebonia sp.]
MTPASPAAAVAREALELFGTAACFAPHAPPAGVWAAPGRVNVIGEHTDYNDGFAAPMAIDRYTAVAAAPRSDGVLRLVSAADAYRGHVAEVPVGTLTPPAARDWTSYPAGVAWALLEAGVLDRGSFAGADLAIASTVPVGAGLSSSAALECATGLALAGLAGADLPPAVLARLAQRAENSYVGVPCGPLDQLAAAFGVEGSVLFIDTRTRAVRAYPFDLPAAGLTLLVIDTKVHHDLGASGYPDRRAACERAARTLGVPALRDLTGPGLRRAERDLDEQTARRVRHVVTEDERVLEFVRLLSAGDLSGARLDEIGSLLTASHISLRDDFDVSCAELDAVVDAALTAGAYGARMTGGGFGGSAIALTSTARVEEVSAAIRAALPQADIFPAVPSPGAHQVR